MSSVVVLLFRNEDGLGGRDAQAKPNAKKKAQVFSVDSSVSKSRKGTAGCRASVLGTQAAAIFSSPTSGSYAVIDRVLTRDFWKAGGRVPAGSDQASLEESAVGGNVFSMLAFRRSG